ncbi:phosphatase [candidate division KSB3 bacterium]|uniref:Phosphatase n=1 Tax=candidate division KSB3 bacterium TaxID=2044937 RepID=A0A2G6K9P4_9BACT|nr:MAG: phosphatase [candidate division KSB3 bacterium]
MPQQYTHILWDWNGTLFNDLWLCIDVMNSLLGKHHLPLLTTETYQRIFTFPVIDYYLALGFDFSIHSFEELSVEFMAQYEPRKHECSLSSGAVTLLERIQQSGIGQSILSAYPYDGLAHLVKHFHIEHFFDNLLGLSDIYASSKVDLGIRWMRQQEHAPSDVLLIGDTIHDSEVAEAIGADCILIGDGHNSKERLQQCGRAVVDSFQDLSRSVSFLN